ncbi:MAG: hypothetical protein ACKOCW_08955 [Planctomycetaceae bacterium]
MARTGSCALVVAALGLVIAGPDAVRADVDPAAARVRMLLAAEPEGALSPTAVKAKLAAQGAPPGPQPIVLAGRIGAKGMEPFLEGKASFVLQEIPADDHGGKPGHDADNCPFCKKRAAGAPMVAVQFVGADGQVVPIDARKLFGVVKGSDVVVVGKAVFDPKLAIPVIQVTAEQIHVRAPAKVAGR